MKRISNLLHILLLHAIWFSACVHAQTASSPADRGPNETLAAIPPRGAPWINVVSYEAKADGLADDTTAINFAMIACTARALPNNGCTLYFPAGVYITTGITLKSYVSMKGDGWGDVRY